MENIRILHVDPDQLTSSLLQEYFSRHLNDAHDETQIRPSRPAYLLTGVSNGEEAFIQLAKEEYDLVLLEIALPKMSGYAALQAIRSSFPNVKVLLLSRENNINVVKRCIQLGAFGFVSKKNSCDRLHVILDIVSSGTPYFDGNFQMLLFKEKTKGAKSNLLSSVDLELLGCLHKGMSRLKMARHLGLADRTIDAHINALQKKLGVGSRVELAVYAERHKLV